MRPPMQHAARSPGFGCAGLAPQRPIARFAIACVAETGRYDLQVTGK